jgi:hypothetical protein
MILTSDAGSGHRSAAAAIEQQVRGFAKTIVVNPAHHPLASRTLERAERFYFLLNFLHAKLNHLDLSWHFWQ